jgi:hypothetical protein
MPTTKTAATETLTDSMIEALRTEAAQAGDMEMIETCDAALAGDATEIACVLRVVNGAREQGEPRVVAEGAPC